jgi:hypothetical protein
MENITLSEALAPQQVPWDYILYIIFAMQVVVLALLFSGSLRDVLMIAVTVLCLIADKTYIFGFIEGGAQTMDAAIQYHTKESPLTFGVRIAMFALPLVITTQTKIPKAKPALVLLALTSVGYTCTRWFFQVFPEAQNDPSRTGTDFVQHTGLMVQAGISLVSLGFIRFGKVLPIRAVQVDQNQSEL